MGLLKEVFELLFDFRKDATDLAEKLKNADANNARLNKDITELTDKLEQLASENAVLRKDNGDLRAEIGRLRGGGG